MHTRKKEKESKLRLRNLSPSFRAASFVLPWALPQFLPILLFSRPNFFIYFIFAVDPLRGRSGDRVEPLLCVYARRPQFPRSRATRHRRRRFPNKWRHRPLIQSLPGADKLKVCAASRPLSLSGSGMTGRRRSRERGKRRTHRSVEFMERPDQVTRENEGAAGPTGVAVCCSSLPFLFAQLLWHSLLMGAISACLLELIWKDDLEG